MPVAPPDVYIDELSDDFTEAQWTESKRLSKQLCAERGVEAAVDKELDSWREERIWRSSGGKSKRTKVRLGVPVQLPLRPKSTLRRRNAASKASRAVALTRAPGNSSR